MVEKFDIEDCDDDPHTVDLTESKLKKKTAGPASKPSQVEEEENVTEFIKSHQINADKDFVMNQLKNFIEMKHRGHRNNTTMAAATTIEDHPFEMVPLPVTGQTNRRIVPHEEIKEGDPPPTGVSIDADKSTTYRRRDTAMGNNNNFMMQPQDMDDEAEEPQTSINRQELPAIFGNQNRGPFIDS